MYVNMYVFICLYGNMYVCLQICMYNFFGCVDVSIYIFVYTYSSFITIRPLSEFYEHCLKFEEIKHHHVVFTTKNSILNNNKFVYLNQWINYNNNSFDNSIDILLNIIHQEDRFNLRPFEGTSRINNKKSNNNSDIDMYINAGGPIWSSALCPLINNNSSSNIINNSVFYLAVGLSQVGWPINNNNENNDNTLFFATGVGADYARYMYLFTYIMFFLFRLSLMCTDI